uniref:KN homeodomain domain-containing protein n=1 Tax=Sinocyclocheilus rhinocerous TaxID=307959 RepID=A0A673NLV9_9TELE
NIFTIYFVAITFLSNKTEDLCGLCRLVFLRRSRQNPGKVRHKRQALQDMARPLKQWLYKHRDNPYPTKTEKILLATLLPRPMILNASFKNWPPLTSLK